MNPSREVKAEIHALAAYILEPSRSGRREVQGYDEVVAEAAANERLLDHLLSPQLSTIALKAQQGRAVFQGRAKAAKPRLGEGRLSQGKGFGQGLLRFLPRRELERVIRRIQIGDGVDHAEHKRQEQRKALTPPRTIQRLGGAAPRAFAHQPPSASSCFSVPFGRVPTTAAF
jgi:hypothetical protein